MVKLDTSKFPIRFPVESLNANHTSICSTFPGTLFFGKVFKVAILTSSVATQNEIIVRR